MLAVSSLDWLHVRRVGTWEGVSGNRVHLPNGRCNCLGITAGGSAASLVVFTDASLEVMDKKTERENIPFSCVGSTEVMNAHFVEIREREGGRYRKGGCTDSDGQSIDSGVIL